MGGCVRLARVFVVRKSRGENIAITIEHDFLQSPQGESKCTIVVGFMAPP